MYVKTSDGLGSFNVDNEGIVKIGSNKTRMSWDYHGNGRVFINYMGKRMLLHRFLMDFTDPKICIDHINGDTMDNRYSNMRKCTKGQNCRNAKKRKDNTSGYKGVQVYGSRFRAVIYVESRSIHLGIYDTKEEAHKAYCDAAVKYHGEFARFN